MLDSLLDVDGVLKDEFIFFTVFNAIFDHDVRSRWCEGIRGARGECEVSNQQHRTSVVPHHTPQEVDRNDQIATIYYTWFIFGISRDDCTRQGAR